MPYVWGVDPALSVTKESYDCVLYNYGKPEFWGRYLTTVPGQSEGITEKEIALLHDSGTRILPIYNQFRQAKGVRNGRVTAANMIFHARLGIPDGKVLFANVERFFPVDAGWISGFVDAFNPSGYKPGIYHDPGPGYRRFFRSLLPGGGGKSEGFRPDHPLERRTPSGRIRTERRAAFQPEKSPLPGQQLGMAIRAGSGGLSRRYEFDR